MNAQKREIERVLFNMAYIFKTNDGFDMFSTIEDKTVLIKYDKFNLSSITAMCKFMSNIKELIGDNVISVYLKNGCYIISFDLTKINMGDLLLDIVNIEKQLMKAKVYHDRFKSSR